MNPEAALAAIGASLLAVAFVAVLVVVFRLGGYYVGGMGKLQYEKFLSHGPCKLLSSTLIAVVASSVGVQVNTNLSVRRAPSGLIDDGTRPLTSASPAEPKPSPVGAQMERAPNTKMAVERPNEQAIGLKAQADAKMALPNHVRRFAGELDGGSERFRSTRIHLIANVESLKDAVCELASKLSELGARADCDARDVPGMPSYPGATILFRGGSLPVPFNSLLIRMAELEIPVFVREVNAIRPGEVTIVFHSSVPDARIVMGG